MSQHSKLELNMPSPSQAYSQTYPCQYSWLAICLIFHYLPQYLYFFSFFPPLNPTAFSFFPLNPSALLILNLLNTVLQISYIRVTGIIFHLRNSNNILKFCPECLPRVFFLLLQILSWHCYHGNPKIIIYLPMSTDFSKYEEV